MQTSSARTGLIRRGNIWPGTRQFALHRNLELTPENLLLARKWEIAAFTPQIFKCSRSKTNHQ